MESFQSVSDGLDSRLGMYAESGLTHYYYCPSDDKYCNRWGWKFTYNDAERNSVKEIMALCRKKNLDFVWTINPSDGYSGSKEDYDFLLNKLVLMYYCGIRSFALNLTDDRMAGEVGELLKKDFALRFREPVSLYVLNQMPVVSYPSEKDPAMTLMKGYHFDRSFMAKANSSCSVICRISEYDGFAGIPIAAAVDFAKDPEGYQPDKSIVDGIGTMPESVRNAFFTFLRHTGGEGESSGIETFTINDWTPEKSIALYEEFKLIESVPALLESAAGTVVMDALRPWLLEFGRLGGRGRRAIECMDYYIKGDVGDFWMAYTGNQMSVEDRIMYEMYPVGAVKLQPFCETLMKELTEAFTKILTGHTNLKNLASTLYKKPNAALDSDFTTSIPSSGNIEFPIPAEANACRLLTGKLPSDGLLLFRQIGTDGELVAEFVIKSPYSEYDLKEGAVKVDVLGDVDIYESIFVYL